MDRANPRPRIGPAALVAVGLMVAPALLTAGGQAGAAPTTTGTLGVSTTRLTLPTTTTVPLVPTVTVPLTAASTAPPITVPATKKPAATRVPASSTSSTTSTSTTTTIAPIPTASPAPVTLPLATEPQSATISPVFSVLSLVGFVALIFLLLAQWYLTGPRRRGPTL